jgi:hypothetical protein
MIPPLFGNYRFEAHKRKLAGVLLPISITVGFFPLSRLAPLINGNGNTVDSGIEFAALMGNLIALAMGLLGITVSWMELVHEYSNANFTFGISIFEILAFVPYVTDIVMIGKAANTGMAFNVPAHGGTESEVWFVGAMGMLGAGTFCLFLFGSFALLVMSLHAFHSNEPFTRNAGYYRTRLTFYSGVMAIAGLAQLMLGAFILDRFGSGPVAPPIAVAMFLIWWPEIAVFVGLVYVLNGLYGIYRGLTKCTDHYFAITMWFQLICTLILMIGVQTWYAPGDMMAKASPTLASLTLGVSLMPIFLDYLGRTMPEEITHDYYYSTNEEMAALTDNQHSDQDMVKSVGVEQPREPVEIPDYDELEDIHV